jgi:hypothetical protein
MKLLSYLFTTLVLFNSCKDRAVKPEKRLLAGEQGLDLSHYNYSPDKTLQDIEISCFNYFDRDSLDINKDNIIDLEITYSSAVPDIYNTCCINPDPTFTCIPTGHKFISVKILNSNFSIATDSFNYIKALPALQEINNSMIWKNNEELFLYQWVFPGSTTGYWINVEEQFVGLKLEKDTKSIFGWIRMSLSTTSPDALIIYDAALQEN